MRQQALVEMTSGTVLRGMIEAQTGVHEAGNHTSQNSGGGLDESIYFEPADGNPGFTLDLQDVKALYLVEDAHCKPEDDIRFFDSIALPSSLWVRLEFRDGEIIEGMMANSLDALSAPVLKLQAPDQSANKKAIWVPRASIAELRVMTTRK
jgi:hypothetical protein